MLEPEIAERVAKATVRFKRLGGRGVLVPGGLIVTAAHCIHWEASGMMVLGEHYVEQIETATGDTLHVGPLCVEPMADIAVVGGLDNQTFWDWADEFEAFCDATPAVNISTEDRELFEEFEAHIFTHKGNLIEAVARQMNPEARSLAVTCMEQIEGGTSGSPIVDAKGHLIGVVSHSSETEISEDRPCFGATPRPHRALPVWLVEEILAATVED